MKRERSATKADAYLGILGGSGLYEMDGLEQQRRQRIETPFGETSDEFVLGVLEGCPVAFLARHGRGHRLMPTEVNTRANIFAFKKLGVEQLVSASAVGSLAEDIAPLDAVVPDQLIDRTRHRDDTFFGGGLVAHVSLADPFCERLRTQLVTALRETGVIVHEGGSYLCMEGPQFSTRAESQLYRQWGAKVIGMTNLQEARLAREAEICFATMALVTDYDCWKMDEAAVSVEAVIDRLLSNAVHAQQAIRILARTLIRQRRCPCEHALSNAIITSADAVPAATRERLAPLLARVLCSR